MNEEHFLVKNEAKWNQNLGIPSSFSSWWLLGTLIYMYPQLPTSVGPQWLPWHRDSLGRCSLASPSGTPVSYLDWKSSQKDSVFAPFGSHSVSSAAHHSTQIKNQFSCKVTWKFLTAWKTQDSVLAVAFGLSKQLTTLKALAIFHMQRTSCPSSLQSVQNLENTLCCSQSSSGHIHCWHSSWFCSGCVCCSSLVNYDHLYWLTAELQPSLTYAQNSSDDVLSK